MANLEEKIAELEKKLKQAKELAAKKQARERAAQQGERRKLESKQRVLIGAFVLDTLKKHLPNDPVADFGVEGYKLKDWLTRDSDRMAFGLQPNKPAGEKIE